MTDDSTAVPIPASNCLQGGPWLLAAYDDIGKHQDDRSDGEGTKQGSTCHHAYEQLLVGWFVGVAQPW
jgi:hypothetical protein